MFDTDLIAQSSIYEPGASQQVVKEGKGKPPPGKRETVIRHGKGRTWEDPTLLDWDPSEWSRRESGTGQRRPGNAIRLPSGVHSDPWTGNGIGSSVSPLPHPMTCIRLHACFLMPDT